MQKDKTSTLIFGHRGVKGKLENTLESFRSAVVKGLDGIELDVWSTMMDNLVIYHDQKVDRLVFKDDFYFDETEGKDIRDLQLYHIYNTRLVDSLGRMYKIPSLEEVLRDHIIQTSNIIINIEIKDTHSHEAVSDLIFMLVDEGLYTYDRFIISSFLDEPIIYFGTLIQEENIESLKIGKIYSEQDIPLLESCISRKCYPKVTTFCNILIFDSSISENILSYFYDKPMMLYGDKDHHDFRNIYGIITDDFIRYHKTINAL